MSRTRGDDNCLLRSSSCKAFSLGSWLKVSMFYDSCKGRVFKELKIIKQPYHKKHTPFPLSLPLETNTSTSYMRAVGMVNGNPLESVNRFNYLGCKFTFTLYGDINAQLGKAATM